MHFLLKNSLLVFLTFVICTCTLAQEKKGMQKSELAGLNSHLSKYETYLKAQEKVLYERLFLDSLKVEAYLADITRVPPAQRSCLVAPGVEIALSFLPESEVKASLSSSVLEGGRGFQTSLYQKNLYFPG